MKNCKRRIISITLGFAIAFTLAILTSAFAGEEPIINITHCGPGIFVEEYVYDKDDNGIADYIRLEVGQHKEPFAEIWFDKDGEFKKGKILRVEFTDFEYVRTRIICDDAKQFISMKSQEKDI